MKSSTTPLRSVIRYFATSSVTAEILVNEQGPFWHYP